MSWAIGLVLLAVGLCLLLLSWKCSQGQLARPVFSVGHNSGSRIDSASTSVEGASIDEVLQRQRERVAAINTASATPLGVTAGLVGLGGLAVLVSGWDVIGRTSTVVTLVVLVAGLGVSWRVAKAAEPESQG